jgi:broad specificity phosphatase PhoE
MTKNNMTTFYIMRHGETDWNKEGRVQGHSDIPLNETGREQAKEISQILKDVHFDEILSSDLSRAVQTAEAIALERKIAIKTSQALREKSYGKYEGRIHSEIVKELQHLFDKRETLSEDEHLDFKIYTDGESDREAVERFILHLREAAVANPGKTILVASHGGIMRYLLIKLGWTTYKDAGRHAIKNTAYIKLESDGINFFVKDLHGIEIPKKKSFSNI